MRTAQEQRTAMRNLVGRKAAATFFQMADGTAGRGYGFEINSFDLIIRHASLSSACDDSIKEHPEITSWPYRAAGTWEDVPNVEDCPIHLSATERDELEQLTDLITQLEGGEDWERGVVLIAEDDFEEHAREKASDDHNSGGADLDDWPYTSIDWSQAAYELQDDYLEGSVDAGTWFVKG
jgi:hypothetical protein